MKKTILSMLFLLAGIGCFAQKSGIIIGVTDGHLGKYSGYIIHTHPEHHAKTHQDGVN